MGYNANFNRFSNIGTSRVYGNNNFNTDCGNSISQAQEYINQLLSLGEGPMNVTVSATTTISDHQDNDCDCGCGCGCDCGCNNCGCGCCQ